MKMQKSSWVSEKSWPYEVGTFSIIISILLIFFDQKVDYFWRWNDQCQYYCHTKRTAHSCKQDERAIKESPFLKMELKYISKVFLISWQLWRMHGPQCVSSLSHFFCSPVSRLQATLSVRDHHHEVYFLGTWAIAVYIIVLPNLVHLSSKNGELRSNILKN